MFEQGSEWIAKGESVELQITTDGDFQNYKWVVQSRHVWSNPCMHRQIANSGNSKLQTTIEDDFQVYKRILKYTDVRTNTSFRRFSLEDPEALDAWASWLRFRSVLAALEVFCACLPYFLKAPEALGSAFLIGIGRPSSLLRASPAPFSPASARFL